MTGGPVPVSADEIAALDGLGDWRFVLGALRADFVCPSFPAAGALVAAFADAAEAAAHHPDLDLQYPGRVGVRLSTHDIGGVSNLDVELARTFSSLAATAGARAEPAAPQSYEIAIDTTDADRIRPFWMAALGYVERDGNLVDPLGRGPDIWFQDMDPPRTQRNRIHLDVSVAHDIAEQRVAAAVAAGGTLLPISNPRAWWALADPDGNEVCISTWQDRT